MSLKDLSATLKLPSQMGLFPFMICDITSNPPWWFSNLNTAEMRHSSLKHGEKKKKCVSGQHKQGQVLPYGISHGVIYIMMHAMMRNVNSRS